MGKIKKWDKGETKVEAVIGLQSVAGGRKRGLLQGGEKWVDELQKAAD